MSFRKRGDVIGGTPISGRNPGSPTAPGSNPGGPGRAPGIHGGRQIPNARVQTPQGSIQGQTAEDNANSIMKNPGVRPSLITSQPTVSTGSSDLDKLLLHQGLPLGHSLLIEESGTTDFAVVLLRAYASQGVLHNRVVKDQINAHVIAVGVSPQWANDLPGLYKGSSKEQKKAKILANESKVSVSNLSGTSTAPRSENDMKIAWRYGINGGNRRSESPEAYENSTYEHYNNQFDITQKLTPGPNSSDISFVSVGSGLNGLSHIQIIQQIQSIIQRQIKNNPGIVIRIVIPGLLNPTTYSPLACSPTFIFPFVHALRSILRQNGNNVVLVASLSLDLYPRDSNLAHTLETLIDSCIHLQPFNQEMSQLIEKAYKNEPSKIQQGLVNIIKLPVLSEKGLMMVHEGEYAFKNGRKRFEIEAWGIPVEDTEKEEGHSTMEGGKTSKNIEF
ncbi:Elongator complex protein 4 [Scheffersomyces xylosifermentans]|uniref:Elongator complex protein 4 n=1 Tax=Scheffersomyces xylosifermentans TaxID=1304137 RepID=UPI00315D84A5